MHRAIQCCVCVILTSHLCQMWQIGIYSHRWTSPSTIKRSSRWVGSPEEDWPDNSISVSGKLVLVIVSFVPGSLRPVSSLSSLIRKLIFKLLLLSLFTSNTPYSPAYPPSNNLSSIPPPSGREDKRGKKHDKKNTTHHHQSTLTSVDRLTSSQETPSTYKNLFSSVVLSVS